MRLRHLYAGALGPTDNLLFAVLLDLGLIGIALLCLGEKLLPIVPSYALLVSLLPATATVVGIVVLAQVPSATEVAGVVLVVTGVALHRDASAHPAPREAAQERHGVGSPAMARET